MSYDQRILDLLSRRDELASDLRMAMQPGANPDPEWMKDRTEEMAYLNRKLAEFGAIPQS